MKKTTPKKLSEQLLKYGAFSAAILGTANANGQIIYTDIADETVDAANARVAIDIDNDTTGDILFGVSTTTQFAFVFPASSSMAPGYNTNLFVGFTSGPYAYPSNLTLGTAIDATNGTFGNQRGDFNYSSCAYSGSQFCSGADGYVGVHFDVGGNTHYGWVRIQVAATGATIIIKDYAYNSVPGQAINAGQTLSIEDNQLSDINITALNKTIAISNLTNNAEYNLIDMTGKSVMNGIIDDSIYTIEANSLSTGVYILQLSDVNSDAVIRKKVVL